jgi:TerC family integral membrane protein
MSGSVWGWIIFNVFILAMLGIDLGVFHRKSHEIRVREALGWSLVWIVLALGFGGFIWWGHERGSEAALEFLTGYLLEKSLSVDNLFVFLLIFHYFQVANRYQHGVLFWGILGALCLRGSFIAAGVVLVVLFHWIIYLFAGFLIYTGIKLAFEKESKIEPEKNPVLRLFRRFVPITADYRDGHFFVREQGRWWATPLAVVLLVIETTDVLFAVDSIPAVLAVTHDPFIVYTSNVFAILGLRSLYFALAGLMRLFHYLHYGLALVLVFVGGKMLIGDTDYAISKEVTLMVVGGIIALAMLASWLFPAENEAELEEAQVFASGVIAKPQADDMPADAHD